MADHFAAFSFVDRITELEPGGARAATFAMPADIAAFPSCLVAEAVGQLAAWVAMAHIGFRGRPVAALAHETRFRADVAPGERARLAVDIECCDDDAVAYEGRAGVDGSDGDRARRLPRTDAAGRRIRLAGGDGGALRRSSVAPARRPAAFTASTLPRVARTAREPGVSASATLTCPSGAVLRRSFPAAPRVSGNAAARRADPAGARGRRPRRRTGPREHGRRRPRMTHVKVRSFIPPGRRARPRRRARDRAERSATLNAVGANRMARLPPRARLDVVARHAESSEALR